MIAENSNIGAVAHRAGAYLHASGRRGVAVLLAFIIAVVIPSPARSKNKVHYGVGLIVNIPLPEAEVEQVVDDVAQNTIIRGTKEYNKDEYVAGAIAVASTPIFPKWTQAGKVFYKVRLQALDPRNFKESADVGTLAVRYVVQPQGEKNTILRIDALFVEDFRHSVHTSNGSVESSEYKDIQDRLAQVELVKKETADALQAKQDRVTKEKFSTSKDTEVDSNAASTTTAAEEARNQNPTSESADVPREENSGTESKREIQTTAVTTVPASAEVSTPISKYEATHPSYEQRPGETLEQHVAELRREAERLVKKPGAPLQSAPFHTATTVKSLEPGAEVLILITTPYWYGVETHDGEHGWIRRDMLEQLP